MLKAYKFIEMAAERKPDVDNLIWEEDQRKLREGKHREDNRISFATAQRILEEFPVARQDQAELLEQLRRMGVVDLIERATGIGIPPISPDDHEDKILVQDNAVIQSERQGVAEGALVFMPAPRFWNDPSRWETNVRIYVLQARYRNGVPKRGQGILALTYSDERSLRVNGQHGFSYQHRIEQDTTERRRVHNYINEILKGNISSKWTSGEHGVFPEWNNVSNAWMMDL